MTLHFFFWASIHAFLTSVNIIGMGFNFMLLLVCLHNEEYGWATFNGSAVVLAFAGSIVSIVFSNYIPLPAKKE